MKTNSILASLTAISFSIGISQAQEAQTIYSSKPEPMHMKTIMKADKVSGGHLSLNVKGSEVYDETAVLVGGELVFTLSHVLNIGLAGYGMPSRVEYDTPDDLLFSSCSLEMGYGGLFVEPIFFDQEVIHFTVPVLIGGGWSRISDQRYYDDDSFPARIVDETTYFVFEPGINAELNLARNVKFILGGTYRLVSGGDLRDLTDSDLSGFSLLGGIRVGWF